jgi:hypothetical protein
MLRFNACVPRNWNLLSVCFLTLVAGAVVLTPSQAVARNAGAIIGGIAGIAAAAIIANEIARTQKNRSTGPVVKYRNRATPAPVAHLSLGSVAYAAPRTVEDLPQSMVGRWCYLNDRKDTTVYRRGKCDEKETEDSDGDITIDAMRFDAWEVSCNVNKIREVIRGKSYVVESKCAGEGEFWKMRTQFVLSPHPHDVEPILLVKTTWTGNRRVEKTVQ